MLWTSFPGGRPEPLYRGVRRVRVRVRTISEEGFVVQRQKTQMAGTQYYAVYRGRHPGIYDNWTEAKAQVEGFPDAVYKKFSDRPRAEAFVRLGPPSAEVTAVKKRMILPKARNDILRFTTSPREATTGEFGDLRAHVQVVLRQSVTDAPARASATRETGAIAVYTDGSCLFQGTPKAVSGLGVVFPDFPEQNTSLPIEEEDGVRATNNRAEIRAILEAFVRADAIDPTRTRALHIYSDSEYSIKILTTWMSAWKRMNWKRKTGEPVLNRDLLVILDKARQQRAFRAMHVRAHTGRTDEHSRYNDLADRAANAAALEAHRRKGATPRGSAVE